MYERGSRATPGQPCLAFRSPSHFSHHATSSWLVRAKAPNSRSLIKLRGRNSSHMTDESDAHARWEPRCPQII